MSAGLGQQIQESDITKAFLTGPGQYLVKQTLLQLSGVELANGTKPFCTVFGPYAVKATKGAKGSDAPIDQQQRWADYPRMDWSIRQLPAISIFEEAPEDKSSDNAWLNGSISMQIVWPPSFRRSDLSRVPAAFKGAIQNFFASQYVADMLDEHASIERPMKVPGLNEFGKVMSWQPNVEGIVEGQMVPVTILSIKYRIDLRSWYRFLEFDARTKGDPFERTLSDLVEIFGEYDGVLNNDASQIKNVLTDQITVSSP